MPELILYNAKVLTLNMRLPVAQLVAVQDGKIAAVVGNDQLNALRTANSRVIDCGGHTLLPGFIDAHCHLRALAESLLTLDLRSISGIRSIADICARIKSETEGLPFGTWIRGYGYHEFDLAEKRHPIRWDLDAVSPHHPVKLAHRSGHAHVLNSRALEIFGISRYSEDPDGGLMDRDLTGEPTGLLYEMGRLLAERMPRIDERDLEHAIKKASRLLLSNGITSCYDASAGNDWSQWQQFLQWKDQGVLFQKMGVLFNPSAMEALSEMRFHAYQNPLHPRPLGIKIILDETTGRLFPSAEDLQRLVLEANRHKLQVAVHAVEEEAIAAAVDAIGNALKDLPRSDHRHRLEHVFLCHPPLITRLAALGIHVVTQPGFIHDNGDRYLKTVPKEKQGNLYPIGSMIKKGVSVAAGSDCPVGTTNPLLGIHATVSRTTRTGADFIRKERISLQDALALYTCNAARSAFEELFKGTIEVGKSADLVLLDTDLQRKAIADIKEAKVDMVILDGQIAWTKEEAVLNS